MKSVVLLFGIAAAVMVCSVPAHADVSLADWCVNNNGSIAVCNGGSSSSASVDTSQFDETLEPANNSLGKIVVTFGTGSQDIRVYMDYDVDFGGTGCGGSGCLSFDDYGT